MKKKYYKKTYNKKHYIRKGYRIKKNYNKNKVEKALEIIGIIISFVITLIAVYKVAGLKGVRNIIDTILEMFSFINLISVSITGDSILVALFATSLQYAIVGLLFKIFKIKKGLFGKIFGKISYFLVSFVVVFVLNFVAIRLLKI